MTHYIVTELGRAELSNAAEFLHRHYDGADDNGATHSDLDHVASDWQTLSEAAAQGRVYALYYFGEVVGVASFSREGSDAGRIKLMEIEPAHIPYGVHAAMQALCEGLQYEGRQRLIFKNERFSPKVQRALGVPETAINHGGFSSLFQRRVVFELPAEDYLAGEKQSGRASRVAVRHQQPAAQAA